MRDAAFVGAMGKLDGRRVAILATDGFEQSELESPKEAVEREGASTQVISLKAGTIRAWKDKNWSGELKVDLAVKDAAAEDFDALLIPGGVMNPDRLRTDEEVVRLVQEFFDAGKPIAAICHGPAVLIETGELEGRRLTSYPSLKTDLVNAGADWVDAEVVEDENLVTSRRPDDLPAFNEKLLEAFGEPQAPADSYQEVEQQLGSFAERTAPMPASFSPPRRPKRPGLGPTGTPSRPESGRAMAREKPRNRRGRGR